MENLENLYIKDIPAKLYFNYITEDMLNDNSPLITHFNEFDKLKALYYNYDDEGVCQISKIESTDEDQYIKELFLKSIDSKYKNLTLSDINSLYLEYKGLSEFIKTDQYNNISNNYYGDDNYIDTNYEFILVKNQDLIDNDEFINTLKSQINTFLTDPKWRVSSILSNFDKSIYKKILNYNNEFYNKEIYDNILKENFRNELDLITENKTVISNIFLKDKHYDKEEDPRYNIEELILNNIESRINNDFSYSLDAMEEIAYEYQNQLLIDSYFKIEADEESSYITLINPDTLFDFLEEDPESNSSCILSEWKVR